MELYDVMRTTFAARDFTDEPVPDAVIRRMLEQARFAPSGGNRQPWRVVVVRDAATREALVPLIAPTLKRYIAQVQNGESPWNTIHPTRLTAAEIAAAPVPEAMIRKLTHAPVVLMVFADLAYIASFDSELDRVGVISGASIYPFVWNVLLAARNEGYGGTLTTFAVGREPDVQALLGVPGHYALAAMLPIGRPLKQLTRLTRKPVDDFVRLERWDGPPLPS